MAVGNFLSALVQRGVQAAGGAARGQQEGRDRAAAQARQAAEDALQRAMIEQRMGTERRQQEALDRSAADFVPHAQRVREALAEIQARKEAQLEVERLRGQNARTTAATPRTNTRSGGRSDPRVGVLNSRISRLRADATKDEEAASEPFRRMRNPAGATADSLRGVARRDSIGTFERARDRIVELGGEAGEGAEAAESILDGDEKTPQQWVDEVAAEHPDWDDNRIVTEAQRRAGVH